METTTAPRRVAHWFASPASVLIIVPALVVGIGVVVLILGRHATRDSTDAMARHQLLAQAKAVQKDVDATLAEADPVIASLAVLGKDAMPVPDALSRLHDVVLGRPGIVGASISFPIGVVWEAAYDDRGGIATSERRDVPPSDDYRAAAAAGKRVWMPPHAHPGNRKVGLTVAQPVSNDDGTLTAVLSIDFDIEELSPSITAPPLEGARTVVFARDGAILAYPSVAPPTGDGVPSYKDYKDPTLAELFTALGKANNQQFVRLDGYLASVAPLHDWYLATLVPDATLFGATDDLNKETIIASSAALLIALGVALMFAWNLLRMQRAVGVARAAAKSALDKVNELGSYRLVDKLGAGGMGEVWRAQHQLLAREAAIKLMRRDGSDDEHVQERFRREAQTLASLRSRNTIVLYDYGVTAEGSFFYVMELLDGLDLAQLVKQHGAQPAARVIHMLIQACNSLAEAHDAGLLHRDIKPANLFLCRAADEVDIIKLLDFGIAHNLAEPVVHRLGAKAAQQTDERLTVEGSVIGTPGYIPPEQATGQPLDARGDLYALGCVAWWLLAGAEVYGGDDLVKTHVIAPIPDLRAVVKGWLPEGLEQLILECLAKSPDARPANARALARALSSIEIPAEEAFTEAKARAWWGSLTKKSTSGPDQPTVASARLMRAEARTVAARRTS